VRYLKNFLVAGDGQDDGQDMVEYGLIVAALVAAGGAAFAAYTGALSTALVDLTNAISAVF